MKGYQFYWTFLSYSYINRMIWVHRRRYASKKMHSARVWVYAQFMSTRFCKWIYLSFHIIPDHYAGLPCCQRAAFISSALVRKGKVGLCVSDTLYGELPVWPPFVVAFRQSATPCGTSLYFSTNKMFIGNSNYLSYRFSLRVIILEHLEGRKYKEVWIVTKKKVVWSFSMRSNVW